MSDDPRPHDLTAFLDDWTAAAAQEAEQAARAEIDPDGVVAALLLQSHVAQAPGDFA